VANQLALQQLLRDGRAVEGQEWLHGSGAVLVEGARHHFLADAILAGDEHGHVLVGDAGRRLPAPGKRLPSSPLLAYVASGERCWPERRPTQNGSEADHLGRIPDATRYLPYSV
jgi:hypothetical protein